MKSKAMIISTALCAVIALVLFSPLVAGAVQIFLDPPPPHPVEFSDADLVGMAARLYYSAGDQQDSAGELPRATIIDVMILELIFLGSLVLFIELSDRRDKRRRNATLLCG